MAEGARLTPWIAAVEVADNVALGFVTLDRAGGVMTIWGIVRPVLAYGLTVAGITWFARRRRATLLSAPMPFGLAATPHRWPPPRWRSRRRSIIPSSPA